MRRWSNLQSPDPWIVLSAISARRPSLAFGVIAALPDKTRIADIEDMFVLGHLCDGALDIALEPGTDERALTELSAAIYGQPLSRPDVNGIPREFTITPQRAPSISAWGPVPAPKLGAGISAAWRKLSSDNDAPLAVLKSYASAGGDIQPAGSAAAGPELTIVDIPLDIAVPDLAKLMSH
jgi:hypothetical protein